MKLPVKQARKVFVLECLRDGRMTNREAARSLELSVRQVQRLKRDFIRKGYDALRHGNTGRKPAHALKEEVKNIVTERAQSEYKGTSCQHMAELLQEEGIRISAKSILRILKERSISIPCSHKTPRKRLRRERRLKMGDMIQIDASPFDWLSTGSLLSLHGAIDDATSAVVALWLEETERLDGYFRVLQRTFMEHGVPHAVYSDAHTIFFSPKEAELSAEEEDAGLKRPLTQFGRVLHTLGIQPIKACSPQAKGRIERLWGTLQRRLPVDFRLAGITTLEKANEFLLGYARKLSEQFGIEARKGSSFMPAPSLEDLRLLLCTRETRSMGGDSTISWRGKKWATIETSGEKKLFRRNTKVEVLTLLDKSVVLFYGGTAYPMMEIPKERKAKEVGEMKKAAGCNPPAAVKGKAHKPAADHPWRRYPKRFEKQTAVNAESEFSNSLNAT